MNESRIQAESLGDRILGIDLGASLIKIAELSPEGSLAYRSMASDRADELGAVVAGNPVAVLAATGAGAVPWLERFAPTGTHVREFVAWSAGGHDLRRAQPPQPELPFLLVSLGTGTSVLRVGGEGGGRVERVGGCALGGGTLYGLAVSLLGCRDFSALVALANRGDRGRADLRVGDIYGDRGPDAIGLPGEVTAANLGKLHREDLDRDAADVARGIMGLVGENVGLLAAHLATQHGAREIVFAGSPLAGNEPLAEILIRIATALGHRACVLTQGAYAGALGALLSVFPEARAATPSP